MGTLYTVHYTISQTIDLLRIVSYGFDYIKRPIVYTQLRLLQMLKWKDEDRFFAAKKKVGF